MVEGRRPPLSHPTGRWRLAQVSLHSMNSLAMSTAWLTTLLPLEILRVVCEQVRQATGKSSALSISPHQYESPYNLGTLVDLFSQTSPGILTLDANWKHIKDLQLASPDIFIRADQTHEQVKCLLFKHWPWFRVSYSLACPLFDLICCAGISARICRERMPHLSAVLGQRYECL